MFDLYQLIQMLTVSDSQGGRALKINANGGIDDINNSMTVSDPRGGRSVKISKDNSGLSYTISANNTPSASHTGNTNETKLNASFLVASNTFTSVSRARFRALFTKSGTAGDCTIRCYINTTDSLSGATLISTSTFASASNIFSQFVRDIIFKSATTFQIYNASNSSSVTDRVGTFAPSTITYNVANSYFIIFSVQLANAADTVSINWYELLNM